MNFSEDEIQTIRHLLQDWGFEYSLSADRDKVIALAVKLGLPELSKALKV